MLYAGELVSRPEGMGTAHLSLHDCLSSKFFEYYSAFANSGGGTIFVSSGKFESDTDETISLLRSKLSDKSIISSNSIKDSDFVKTPEGFKLDVTPADRFLRPVYLGSSPETGTFVWKDNDVFICETEQVMSMIRDGSTTYDGTSLNDFVVSAINQNSVDDFKSALNKDHMWKNFDAGKLIASSLIAREQNGSLKPTVAGLLLFSDYHIAGSYLRGYRLRYSDKNWTVDSEDGRWTGNIHDFRSEVKTCVSSIFKNISEPIMELVTNALVHADYNFGDGVSIVCDDNSVVITNYGLFRSSVDSSIKGERNRRNPIMANIIGAISHFRGLGHAIQSLQKFEFNTYIDQDLVSGKVTVTVKSFAEKGVEISPYAKKVLELVTANKDLVIDQISEKIGLGRRQTERYISELRDKGIIEREGSRRSGKWKML